MKIIYNSTQPHLPTQEKAKLRTFASLTGPGGVKQ